MKNWIKTLLSLILLLSSPSPGLALESLSIDKSKNTVSGVSSGGYMAIQLGVAFSENLVGIASVAGGLYWCAEGDKNKSLTQCMGSPEQIQTDKYVEKTKQESAARAIDPWENLIRTKVFLFHSEKDFVIRPASLDKQQEYFQKLGVKELLVQKEKEAAHGFPTLNYGNPCTQMGSPWLLKCNKDLAGDLLQFFYGPLQAPVSPIPGNLKELDQNVFGAKEALMFPKAWVYVPTACQNKAQCRLHIVLHGCQMNPDFIQKQFVENAGFNAWAESNEIVVLYPQSAKSKDNPYACWDWFGFTGKDYVLKSGKQMQVFERMLKQLGAL